MSDEIKKMWQIIAVGNNSILELRAFHYEDKSSVRKKIFYATDFSSIDELKNAFENLALEWNKQGFNIYTTLNPISSTFGGGSAGDDDIDYRDLLLIDIDRRGNTKVPATEQEVKAAKSLADEIVVYLDTLGWPKPIQVMSGNGAHAYYVLDQLENDDETKALIKLTLKNLARRFNNPEVHVDTGVFNAGRITKVPGTIMRKGEQSKERPYRMATVYA